MGSKLLKLSEGGARGRGDSVVEALTVLRGELSSVRNTHMTAHDHLAIHRSSTREIPCPL